MTAKKKHKVIRRSTRRPIETDSVKLSSSERELLAIPKSEWEMAKRQERIVKAAIRTSSSGLPWSEWRFVRDGKVHAVYVRSRFQVNDARVLRDAALAGHGIVLQADLILREDIAAGRLVPLLPRF